MLYETLYFTKGIIYSLLGVKYNLAPSVNRIKLPVLNVIKA